MMYKNKLNILFICLFVFYSNSNHYNNTLKGAVIQCYNAVNLFIYPNYNNDNNAVKNSIIQ